MVDVPRWARERLARRAAAGSNRRRTEQYGHPHATCSQSADKRCIDAMRLRRNTLPGRAVRLATHDALLLHAGILRQAATWGICVRTWSHLSVCRHVEQYGRVRAHVSAYRHSWCGMYAYVCVRGRMRTGALMLRVVAIANAKGGTAKTTSTVALAAEAAHRGFRTLLLDLDVQANATDQVLGDAESDGGRGFFRAVIDGDPLEFVATSTPQLSLVPAGRRTQDLADALARLVRDAAPEDLGEAYRTMRASIHEACSRFDFVFIDTPPSEQSATLLDFVYAAATHVLLPTKIDRNSTGAVSNALTQLVRLARRGATVGDPIGILLVDVDTAATRLVAGALENVEHIGGIVEPFAAMVSHRAGPVAYAREQRMTPHQFQAAARAAGKRRFAALRAGAHEENPPWNEASATNLVADYAAVFDELLGRINQGGLAR